MPACFIASYSISKPPASLCSSIHPWSAPSFVFPRCRSALIFFPLPPLSLSPVFTPSICLITWSSPFSLFALFVLTSRLFLVSYPSSLFVPPPPSVIPSSSSPSGSVYWVLSSTHSLVDKWFIFPKNPHNHLQTSLFNQPQLFHSCHFLQIATDKVTPPHKQMCFAAFFFFLFLMLEVFSHISSSS